MIKIKHIHDKPSPDDGKRIYIDRLWADSAFTEFVKIDAWNQDVAPSYELWRFHYDPDNWLNFVELYKQELQLPEKQKALAELAELARNGTVTLVYGNSDKTHNCAQILKAVLEETYLQQQAVRV